MPDIMGVELKKIKIDIGVEHDCIIAKLYIDGKKSGEVINDGWSDELYIEFINEKAMDKFNNIVKQYYNKNKIKSKGFDKFIEDLLHLNGYYKSIKDSSRDNCYQLILFN